MPPLMVVVVDDTLDYRQIVRALLADLLDLVTIVGEAADGQEGLAVVLRERPDIVITDMMPAIRDLIGRRLSGGSGPLPSSTSGTSASAAAPK